MKWVTHPDEMGWMAEIGEKPSVLRIEIVWREYSYDHIVPSVTATDSGYIVKINGWQRPIRLFQDVNRAKYAALSCAMNLLKDAETELHAAWIDPRRIENRYLLDDCSSFTSGSYGVHHEHFAVASARDWSANK